MSRFNSWLNELQPEMFVELSPELAAERGIEHGGWLTVRVGTRPDRGPRDGDAAAAAAARRGPRRPPDRPPVPLGLRRRGRRRQRQRPDLAGGRPQREHARGEGVRLPGPRRPAGRPRRRIRRSRRRPGRRAIRSPTRRPPPSRKGGSAMASRELELVRAAAGGRSAAAAGCRRSWIASSARSAAARLREPRPATGFYTDTTVCIGCKACEVACKQWNQLPADGFDWTGNSYDNTGELSATSWRHVKFIEQFPERDAERPSRFAGRGCPSEPRDGRWLMMSDVCKHCVAAPCQQACPTGAIIHNEFANVYIQPDICNGCAYCIAACPVRRHHPQPASTATPTSARSATTARRTAWSRPAPRPARPQSIQFGPIDELRERARRRVEELHAARRRRSATCTATPRRTRTPS